MCGSEGLVWVWKRFQRTESLIVVLGGCSGVVLGDTVVTKKDRDKWVQVN